MSNNIISSERKTEEDPNNHKIRTEWIKGKKRVNNKKFMEIKIFI